MTPLARAVLAMRGVFWRPTTTYETTDEAVLFAALEVLGPVIVERAREEGPRIAENFPASPTYPDWPAIRASLTETD